VGKWGLTQGACRVAFSHAPIEPPNQSWTNPKRGRCPSQNTRHRSARFHSSRGGASQGQPTTRSQAVLAWCGMNLASLLSIPPLSKVQVASRTVIREAGYSSGPSTLPFWFFQCVRDGLLELRSPGGYVQRVSPHDVCDVVAAEPLIVNAMPRARFTQRLALSVQERQRSYGDHLFEPAQVMWVTKDKWARVDSVYLRFISDAHNDDPGTFACSVSDESRKLLNTVARRDRLPVVKYGDSPSACAISRERREYVSARRRAGTFLRSTLKGVGQVSMPSDW
jgi:hypothetical protein